MRAERSDVPDAVVHSRYVTLGRQRFHFYAWGDAGPVIVMVHATGFHGYVWKPVAKALGSDCRVLALDQRGHGNSVKPERGYTWDLFGEDLYQFITALQLTEVFVVGHSAGATAAAVCAARYPGVIRRAVLIDPVIIPRLPDAGVDNPMAHRARKRRMLWENRASMFASFRTRPPFNTWREDVLWAYIEEGTILHADGRSELKCPGTIEAQIYENAGRLDGFAMLPQVGNPVLLLRGERSDTFPEPLARQVLSLLPQGHLETIAGATHFVPMEQPEAVERAVRRFFSL